MTGPNPPVTSSLPASANHIWKIQTTYNRYDGTLSQFKKETSFQAAKKNIDPETAVEWNGQSFDESLPRGNLGS